MIQTRYTLTEKKIITPARWRLDLQASSCPPMQPGQFFLAKIDDPAAGYLRRALFPVPHNGGLRLEISAAALADSGLGWLVSRKTGETVDLLGPLGNGFAPPPGAKNILLAGLHTHAHVLTALANDAAHNGKNVTVALHAPAKRYLFREVLHPAVELLVATDDGSFGRRGSLISLLTPFLLWADFMGVAGNNAVYRALRTLIPAHRPALAAGFAQFLLADAPLNICGTGACGYCTINTARGVKLACVAGPVFDAAELSPEALDD